MPLTPGDKLGPYEILGLLGKGGMGEVYRAHDDRLRRDVAIKVSNAQFTERFTREARTVASLNHTNIAHLYDVGPNYLVMELVEGEDLKGPLDFEDALPILQQLIDGIEAAHEKNIIHRDLKPANIKITPEGIVKILDFGLAKAMDPASSPDADPGNSPTLTMGATAVGTILGTAAYMAPEQAKGKQADKRSDIWSFGVIVYELLTGQRLFQGETAVEILSGVLNKDLNISAAPARVQPLLRWCLQHDRKLRLASISDARHLLTEQPLAPLAAVAEAPAKAKAGWFAAAALALTTALALWAPWRTLPTLDRPLTRLRVDLGPEAQQHARISVIISPDGTRIVYTAKAASGLLQLMTRRLDQANATVLVATPALDFLPFFSPDSQWVGFWNAASGQIMKVPAQGGAAVSLGTPARLVIGASWGDDNNILLGSTVGLWRLPASGGTPQQVPNATRVNLSPQVLPGSKAALVNSVSKPLIDNDEMDIDVLQLGTGERKTLIRGGYGPRYLPTSGTTGHLLYIHAGALYGVGFDPGSLELLGTPTVLLDDVAADPSFAGGGGQFDFSRTGSFIYLSGKAQGTYPISWLDASGKIAPLLSTSGIYGAPRLSPDGKRLAYLATGGKGSDVWVYDIDRGTPTQLTFTGGLTSELAWAPDSKHLVYGDRTGLWWIRADGAGQQQPLLEKADNPRPFSFAPTKNNNETRLAFSPSASGSPYISTLPIDLTDPERPKPGKPETFLAQDARAQVDPAFSPDGKFIAYASAESGVEEVFVRPFPGPGGKWKVSSKGKFPVWSAATHELLFLGGDDRIMAASYTTQGDAFSAGVPRVWSPTQVRRNGIRESFDVSPDGKRVVMFPRPVAEESTGNLHATFLLNFTDEVRRRVPLGK